MKKTEKKYIAPNEASLKRWIGTLAVGFLLGSIVGIPLIMLSQQDNSFMGIRYSELFGHLAFLPMFLCMVLAIKWIGKTSLKDFILGVGGKVNKKESLTIMGLYVTGMVICFLLISKYIYPRHVNAGEYAFLFVFMVLTTWAQTTWEELVFRGFAIRWACKNDVRFNKKAVILAIVTAVAFALSHAPNAEVTTQPDVLRKIMAVSAYAVPGLLIFFADLYFGSLLPGILIHWVNNFFLFTVISADVTVMPVPTLLADSSPHLAEFMVLCNLGAYVPLFVYIFLDARKKKAAAQA
jgi:membrane protease YdiL (CAAX protease family)